MIREHQAIRAGGGAEPPHVSIWSLRLERTASNDISKLLLLLLLLLLLIIIIIIIIIGLDKDNKLRKKERREEQIKGQGPEEAGKFNKKGAASMPRFSTANRMPCHTVGTPVLSSTPQSSMHCSVDSGSMNLPVMTILQPSMRPTKGTPQLSTWNIGTKGSTTCDPRRPS